MNVLTIAQPMCPDPEGWMLLGLTLGGSLYMLWLHTTTIDDSLLSPFFLSYLFQSVVFPLAIVLSNYEHTRIRGSSGTLLMFYLMFTLLNLVRLRTWNLVNPHPSNSHVTWALVGTTVTNSLAFAVELWPKPSHQYMLAGEDLDYDCPEEKANIFSRITFSWMSSLLALGYQRVLTLDDMWDLPRDVQTKPVSDRFQRFWKREQSKSKPSLVKASIYTFGGPFALAAIFKLGQDILAFVQPQLLGHLLRFIQDYTTEERQPNANGYFIALSMFFTAVLQTGLLHQYFQLCMMTGLRVRAGLVTAIYRKALTLSNSARQQFTVGEIVNRMSVDAQRLSDLTTYLHIVWSGFFQVSMCLYLLFNTLGWSAFAGVVIMILSIPINGVMAGRMRNLQKKQMKNKDVRIKLMDEILNGIKVIKLYAWEKAFLNRVHDVRNGRELRTLRDYAKLNAFQSFLLTCIPFLVSFFTFGVYALFDNQSRGSLSADLIFVSLSLLNLLRFPLMALPMVISAVIEASVAVGRISAFLMSEELDPNAVMHKSYVRRTQYYPVAKGKASQSIGSADCMPEVNPVMVEIKGGQFTWLDDQLTPTLDNINLVCRKGELMAIVGKVGSGKSSLVSALLGDMRRLGGEATVCGQVAYVSQQSWIMNATLRENILFGHRYEPEFYQRTIKACSLQQDLDMLAAGDLTEIGEKGINLSGGQKARVSLARAVYARADVYLLDDPLSAVDAHVGRHIFNHVLGPQGLLRTKARILVTHAVKFLPKVDKIVLLKNGCISEQGEYQTLMERNGDLTRLIRDFGEPSESETVTPAASTTISEGSTPEASTRNSPSLTPDLRSSRSREQLLGTSPSHSYYQDDTPIDPNDAEPVGCLGESEESSKLSKPLIETCGRSLRRPSVVSIGEHQRRKKGLGGEHNLMTMEESAHGKVKWDVYRAYAKACSPQALAFYALAVVLMNFANVGGSVWLKYWSNANDNAGPEGTPYNIFYLSVYGALGLISSLAAMVVSIVVWVFCAIRAARTTHDTMLQNVIRSPMSFFDTTPLGRIVNRFSKDQYTIDEVLPRSFTSYFQILVSLMSVMAVITVSTPVFLVMFLPLVAVYIIVQRYYLATSRELKRLDSTTRSPIYAHFQETLGGVTTIRAYQQTDRFMAENESRLEQNLRAYYPYVSLNRWLAVRLESIGSFIILGASLLSVITLIYLGGTDAGLVGLSVSYSLNITQSLNWCIRQYCEIETNIVSMERVKEYSELPSEAPDVIPDQRPSEEWPSEGTVDFTDYATRYRPGLDLVLKGVSFNVKPKEKIGIVGRTGAGKSSLTLSLFRIIEAAEGQISIDGVDISKIGLYDLRSRLTIIPQDPVLFTGTIRDNLDPFNAHDDDALWAVLESSHLKDYVVSLPDKLEHEVQQGGENFSVGQRQLICLARALLRHTNVLIMDEATAAIDVETDKLIQETIRREFADCTILTIAHRINTVLDSDRIVVMDGGRVVEFDTPQTLLADKDSIFYGLANHS
ncbi:hypothetical protein IWQ61_005966 [Dispira simplex]|nr:hypothetical protein IWQ61_005966 [Dispira simplex]